MAAAGLAVDAGTTGYQRVLGGILVPTIALLVFKWRSAHAHGADVRGQDLAGFAAKNGGASGRGCWPTPSPARRWA